MKGVVLIFVVLSLFVCSSTAGSFGACFAQCYGPCCNTPFDSIPCTGKCMGQCAFMASAINNNKATTAATTYNFCRLGCATSLCTKFGTNNDLTVKKVESCVNSCSRTCMNA